MIRSCRAVLVGLVAFAAAAPLGAAGRKDVALGKTWSGSIENENAAKPECLVSAKALEAIWKEWKLGGEPPKVDFAKDIVVAVYSSGSLLKLSNARLDDAGNLEVLGLGTLDLHPGFRYVMAVVKKDGIKTVNGKPLPKE